MMTHTKLYGLVLHSYGKQKIKGIKKRSSFQKIQLHFVAFSRTVKIQGRATDVRGGQDLRSVSKGQE